MLVQTLLILGDGDVVLLADVVDEDDSVVSTTGYEVGVLHAELAGGDLALAVEYLFRESRIFEGPKHKESSSR